MEQTAISGFLDIGMQRLNRNACGRLATGVLVAATIAGTPATGVLMLNFTAESTMALVIMDQASTVADGRAEPSTTIQRFGE